MKEKINSVQENMSGTVDFKRWKRVYLLTFIIIGLALAVLECTHEFWYDEAFTMAIVRHSFRDIVSFTASDVHPPLYYFIVKCVAVIFGYNTIVYHGVTWLGFMLMLIAIGRLFRKTYGIREALVTVLLVCGAPSMMLYAVEMRSYSWAMLMVVLSMILAFLLTQKQTVLRWAGLAIVNVLAAYLHYFAGAAVILISGVLLLYLLIFENGRFRNLLHWILTMAVTFVLYIPWLLVFFRQLHGVEGGYWIDAFRLSNLRLYAEFVCGRIAKHPYMHIALLVFLVLTIALLVWQWQGDIHDRLSLMCLLVFFGYILCGIALSVLLVPVFNKRYIILVLPLLWIGVAGIWLRDGGHVRLLLLGLIASLLCVISYEDEFTHRMDDDTISAYYELEEDIRPGDVIYSTNQYVMAEMVAYFPENTTYLPKKTLREEAFNRWDEMASTQLVDNVESYTSDGDDSVWLLVYKDHEHAKKAFENSGYQVKDIGKYNLGWDGWGSDSIRIHIYHCTKQN